MTKRRIIILTSILLGLIILAISFWFGVGNGYFSKNQEQVVSTEDEQSIDNMKKSEIDNQGDEENVVEKEQFNERGNDALMDSQDEKMVSGAEAMEDRQFVDLVQSDLITEAENNEIALDKLDYCSDEPKMTDMGSKVYPVNKKKYGNLRFLGAIFTANDCGEERVNEFYGGFESSYDLGSGVRLKNNPMNDLITTFKNIGFSCGDNTKLETECIEWELYNKVKVKEILELQPYHENFKIDDCRNCG